MAQDVAFDRADGILNSGLNNLMLRFEETQPDFFRDYTNVRLIIDRPGGHGNGSPPTPPAPRRGNNNRVASSLWLDPIRPQAERYNAKRSPATEAVFFAHGSNNPFSRVS